MIPSSYRGSLQVSLRPAPLHLSIHSSKAVFIFLHVETDVSLGCLGCFVFPCCSEDSSSPQLQEDSEAELLNRECLGVTPFDDHATPCWALFMGVIGSLNRMLLCGNAAAFPATRSCPGWGAPARKQDRNKPSECERGWCGPPSFISRCDAVPADGI